MTRLLSFPVLSSTDPILSSPVLTGGTSTRWTHPGLVTRPRRSIFHSYSPRVRLLCPHDTGSSPYLGHTGSWTFLWSLRLRTTYPTVPTVYPCRSICTQSTTTEVGNWIRTVWEEFTWKQRIGPVTGVKIEVGQDLERLHKVTVKDFHSLSTENLFCFLVIRWVYDGRNVEESTQCSGGARTGLRPVSQLIGLEGISLFVGLPRFSKSPFLVSVDRYVTRPSETGLCPFHSVTSSVCRLKALRRH